MKLDELYLANDNADKFAISPETLQLFQGLQPNQPEAEEVEEQEEDPDQPSQLEDLGVGLVAGGQDFLDDWIDLAQGIGEFGYGALQSGISTIDPDVSITPNETLKAVFDYDLPEVAQPKTTAGQFVRDAGSLLGSIVGAGKLLKVGNVFQGTTKLARTGRFLAPGAIASAIGLEPYEARLSNILDDYPTLQNPITDLLRSDSENSITEERVLSAIESIGLDAATFGLFRLIAKPLAYVLRREWRLNKAVAEGATPEQINKINEDSIVEITEVTEKAKKTKAKPKIEESTTFSTKELTSMKEFFKNPQSIPPNDTLFNTTKFDSETTVSALEKLKEEVPKIVGRSRKALSTTAEEAMATTNNMLSDVVKPGQVVEFAQAVAKDTGKIDESIIALKLMVENFRRSLTKQAESLTHTTSPEVEAQFMNNLSQWMELVDNLKTGITGTARAVSAGRIRIGEAGGDPFKLQKMLKDEGLAGNAKAIAERLTVFDKDPSKFLKEAYNYRKTGFFDVTGEIFRGSILANVKTNVTNLLSGVSENLIYPLERYVGNLVTPGEKASFRQLMTHYKGMVSQFLPALKMARRSLYHEQNFLDPLATKIDGLPRHMITAEKMGLKDSTVVGESVNFLGKVSRMSLRLLGSEDEFFKQLAYRAKLYSESSMAGVEQGLRGRELRKFIDNQIDSAFDPNTGKALNESSVQIARQVTFTEDLARGTLPRDMQIMIGKHPILGMFIPFIRTPTNLFIRGYQRTPMSLIMNRVPFYGKKLRDIRETLIQGNPEMKALLRGRMALGTMLYGTTLAVVLDGKITGAGPANFNQKRRWIEAGNQPYSIMVGGEWIGYNRLDPLFLPFTFVANMADNIKYMPEEDADALIIYTVLAFQESIVDKAYFQGFTNLLELLTLRSYTDDIDADLWKTFSRMGASFIPAFPTQIRSMVTGDNAFKEASSFYNQVMKRINPDAVPDLYSEITGKVIEMPDGYNTGIPVVKPLNDPTMDELARLGQFLPRPSRHITDNIELDDAQFAELKRLTGTTKINGVTLKQALDAIIRSPQYQAGYDPDERLVKGYADEDRRLKQIKEIIAEYRSKARELLEQTNLDFYIEVNKERYNENKIKRGAKYSELFELD